MPAGLGSNLKRPEVRSFYEVGLDFSSGISPDEIFDTMRQYNGDSRGLNCQ